MSFPCKETFNQGLYKSLCMEINTQIYAHLMQQKGCSYLGQINASN